MNNMTLLDALMEDHKMRRREIDLLGFKVWVSPVTLEEYRKITVDNAFVGPLGQLESSKKAIDIIIMKVTDEAGAKIFSEGDRDNLMRKVAADRLTSLASEIMDAPKPEAAEKVSSVSDAA